MLPRLYNRKHAVPDLHVAGGRLGDGAALSLRALSLFEVAHAHIFIPIGKNQLSFPIAILSRRFEGFLQTMITAFNAKS